MQNLISKFSSKSFTEKEITVKMLSLGFDFAKSPKNSEVIFVKNTNGSRRNVVFQKNVEGYFILNTALSA